MQKVPVDVRHDTKALELNLVRSRLVYGVRGYRLMLVCQIAVATCYYGVQLVYGYLVRLRSLKALSCALYSPR